MSNVDATACRSECKIAVGCLASVRAGRSPSWVIVTGRFGRPSLLLDREGASLTEGTPCPSETHAGDVCSATDAVLADAPMRAAMQIALVVAILTTADTT